MQLENDLNLQQQDVNSTFPVVMKIVESLKKILEEDKKQRQPLFINVKESVIFNLARRALNEPGTRFLIGIAGESASGKTTFVQNAIRSCIAEERTDVYTIVCCDDYYHDWSKELREAGSYEAFFAKGYSFDTPAAVNLQLMKEHLISLKNGSAVRSPDYNFATCESKPHGVLKKPAKIIVNEGLYVLNEGVRDIMDVKVYVFTPFDIIKDRWYIRAESRGKTGKAADMQFENVNLTAQTYIRPAMQTADIVMNGVVSSEYIQEITEKIFRTIDNIAKNRYDCEQIKLPGVGV
ncbi:TPA: hypothetical protein IAD52_08570 [Candidatus Spyradomonas excrementavium]|nr:hypothetical protein [Candidatus Spyradomonas excrementavium]